MSPAEFKATLSGAVPPPEAPPPLRALWFDKQEQWHAAHDEVQDGNDPGSAWVHAYLHRKEGDVGNAAYWYRIAGKKVCELPLEQEWEEIVESLLQ